MSNLKDPTELCAACGGALPVGVKVAFFVDQESDDAYLGDFCCVAHAFSSLDEIAGREEVPETLYLGVRVDRDEHDEAALASVMADLARRAVRAAMAEEKALLGEEDDTLPPPPPSSMLN
jgi:hypothetical protein